MTRIKNETGRHHVAAFTRDISLEEGLLTATSRPTEVPVNDAQFDDWENATAIPLHAGWRAITAVGSGRS